MQVRSVVASQVAPRPAPPSVADAVRPEENDAELRQAFDRAIGETLFAQMLKSMRRTVGKPAYFHGGRAEEVFQQQLDQVLAEKLSKSTAEQFTGPMFELFTMERR
ncbi:MAG: rod-binding protein [Thermoguttaceae bacterium]|nr:rod-binding protein [Thermoguttaceae bacterium]